MAIKEKVIRVTIEYPDKVIRAYPDQDTLYWDYVMEDETGAVWVYQSHVTSILDMVYRAVINGYKVTLRTKGGDDCVI